MRLDLHIHSIYSSDSVSAPRDILKIAKKMGLRGLSITDHNEVKAYEDVKDFARELGLILVRGYEISTSKGHLLAYGIDRKIEKGLSPERTIELIGQEGGICVIPHPTRLRTGIGVELTEILNVAAIETINARSHRSANKKARILAEARKIPVIGSSDSHKPSTVGRAWTQLPDDISSEEEVIEAIIKGKTTAEGCGMGTSEILIYGLGAVPRWIGRKL